MKRILGLLSIILVLVSCNRDSRGISNYLESVLKTGKVEYTKQDKTAEIKIKSDSFTTLSNEQLASIAVVTLYDTLDHLSQPKPEKIKTIVDYKGSIDTFTYDWKDVPIFKNYLYASSAFVESLLQGKVENTALIIDSTMIPAIKYPELNALGVEIHDKFPEASLKFDGFQLELDENKIIQVSAHLIQNNETLPLTFQFNLQNGKLFYFGING